jgi:hypothetical protein
MLYNMTTEDRTYGNNLVTIVVPASEQDGARGPGVPIDLRANLALYFSQFQAREDIAAGVIQIEN